VCGDARVTGSPLACHARGVTNDVSSAIYLAFLNDAWGRAAETPNSLLAQLQADQVVALSLVKQGSIAMVGKNSTSQSYFSYGPGRLTQVQIVEVIGNLIGLYGELQSRITDAFEDDLTFGPTVPPGFDFDGPIFTLLTQVLSASSAGVGTLLTDISRLRLPFVPGCRP
jgi:hypothetical protein